jgi:hypothetical protein
VVVALAVIYAEPNAIAIGDFQEPDAIAGLIYDLAHRRPNLK